MARNEVIRMAKDTANIINQRRRGLDRKLVCDAQKVESYG